MQQEVAVREKPIIDKLLQGDKLTDIDLKKIKEESYKESLNKISQDDRIMYNTPSGYKMLHAIIDLGDDVSRLDSIKCYLENDGAVDIEIPITSCFDTKIKVEHNVKTTIETTDEFCKSKNYTYGTLLPLQFAILRQDIECVKLLMNDDYEKKRKHYEKGMLGKGTFMIAMEIADCLTDKKQIDEYKILKLLLKTQTEKVLQEKDSNGYSFLNWLLENSFISKKYFKENLLEEIQDTYKNLENKYIDLKEPNNETPLMIEIRREPIVEKNMEFLLDLDADVKQIENSNNETALFLTASIYNETALKIIAAKRRTQDDKLLLSENHLGKRLIEVALETERVNENVEKSFKYVQQLCELDFKNQFPIEHSCNRQNCPLKVSHCPHNLLIQATILKHTKIITYLITSHDVDCFERVYKNKTSAFTLAVENHLNISASCMLQYRNERTSVKQENMTLTEQDKRLLKSADNAGDTDLHRAIKKNNEVMFDKLMKIAQDGSFQKYLLVMKNNNGLNLAMAASLKKETVKLAKKINKLMNDMKMQKSEMETKTGDTPISIAVYTGNEDCLEMYERENKLSKNNLEEIQNKDGNKLVTTAALGGSKNTMKYLVEEKKCDIKTTNNVENNVGHSAVDSYHETTKEIMEYIYQQDPPLYELKNKAGQTPFLYACNRLNFTAIHIFCTDSKFAQSFHHEDPNKKNGMQIMISQICSKINRKKSDRKPDTEQSVPKEIIAKIAENKKSNIQTVENIIKIMMKNGMHLNEDIFGLNSITQTVYSNCIPMFIFLTRLAKTENIDIEPLLTNEKNQNAMHIISKTSKITEWEKNEKTKKQLGNLYFCKDEEDMDLMHYACQGGQKDNIKMILSRSKYIDEEYKEWTKFKLTNTTKSNKTCFDLAVESNTTRKFMKAWKEEEKKPIIELLYYVDLVTNLQSTQHVERKTTFYNHKPYVEESIRFLTVQTQHHIQEVENEKKKDDETARNGTIPVIDNKFEKATAYNCATTILVQAIVTNDFLYLKEALATDNFKTFVSKLPQEVNKSVYHFLADKHYADVWNDFHDESYGLLEQKLLLQTCLTKRKNKNDNLILFPFNTSQQQKDTKQLEKNDTETSQDIDQIMIDDGLPLPVFAFLMESFKVVPLLLSTRQFDLISVGLQILCLIQATKTGILPFSKSHDQHGINQLQKEIEELVRLAVNLLFKDSQVQSSSQTDSRINSVAENKTLVYNYFSSNIGKLIKFEDENIVPSTNEESRYIYHVHAFHYGPKFQVYYNDQEFSLIELAEIGNHKDLFTTQCLKYICKKKWNSRDRPIVTDWIYNIFNVDDYYHSTKGEWYKGRDKIFTQSDSSCGSFTVTPKMSFVSSLLLHLIYLIILFIGVVRPYNSIIYYTLTSLTVYLFVEEIETMIRQWKFISAKRYDNWAETIDSTIKMQRKVNWKQKWKTLCTLWIPDYLKNIWNLINIAGISVTLAGIVSFSLLVQTAEGIPQNVKQEATTFYVPRIILSYGFFLQSAKLLVFGRYFKKFGTLVEYMYCVLKKDFAPVLLLLSIIAVSFGVTYSAILYPLGYVYDEKGNVLSYNYYQILDMLASRFRQMFGESNYELERDCINGESSDNCPNKHGLVFTRYISDIFFVIIVNLLILTLLIAKVNFTVNATSEDTEASWRFYRYKLLKEYSQKLPFLFGNVLLYLCIPIYIVVGLFRKAGEVQQDYNRIWLALTITVKKIKRRICCTCSRTRRVSSAECQNIQHKELQDYNKWWQSLGQTIKSIDMGNEQIENFLELQANQFRQKRTGLMNVMEKWSQK